MGCHSVHQQEFKRKMVLRASLCWWGQALKCWSCLSKCSRRGCILHHYVHSVLRHPTVLHGTVAVKQGAADGAGWTGLLCLECWPPSTAEEVGSFAMCKGTVCLSCICFFWSGSIFFIPYGSEGGCQCGWWLQRVITIRIHLKWGVNNKYHKHCKIHLMVSLNICSSLSICDSHNFMEWKRINILLIKICLNFLCSQLFLSLFLLCHSKSFWSNLLLRPFLLRPSFLLRIIEREASKRARYKADTVLQENFLDFWHNYFLAVNVCFPSDFALPCGLIFLIFCPIYYVLKLLFLSFAQANNINARVNDINPNGKHVSISLGILVANGNKQISVFEELISF